LEQAHNVVDCGKNHKIFETMQLQHIPAMHTVLTITCKYGLLNNGKSSKTDPWLPNCNHFHGWNARLITSVET
jgi:hypothetical protein